jgi:predicted acetyltransferase
MKQLAPAPESLTHGRVKLIFDTMTEGDEERGFVPGYRFRIVDDQDINVGHLSFRVGDTEHVRLAAGHIGYEVAEAHRGHGYAVDACLAVAPWISEISESVLITVDPDNFPSIRTVERIGATFLDEVDVPEGDPHYLRGSYRKRRYHWNPTKREQAAP